MARKTFREMVDYFVGEKSPLHEPIKTLKEGSMLRLQAADEAVFLMKKDGVFVPVGEDEAQPHLELCFTALEDMDAFLSLGGPEEVGSQLMDMVNHDRARINTLRPFVDLLQTGVGFFLDSINVLSAPLDYSQLVEPLELRDIAFTKILDVAYLQEVVDELARITGVRLWIMDMNSMPVVVSSAGGEHCKLIINSLKGVRRCYDSAIGGLTELKKTMAPKIRLCHAGFICFDAPLIVGGEMVGMISGDASTTEAPDREEYRQLAEDLDIDPEPLLDSLDQVRCVNVGEVEFLLSVVNAIARVVTEMSFKQYLLSDLYRELGQKNVELKALFQAITNIQERERAAVARDLHDDSGQNLTNALVNLEMALGEGGTEQDRRNHIESASSSISSVLKRLHDLSASLHPPVLDDLGLTEALRNLVRQMNADYPINFKLSTRGEEGELPSEVKINLYRIVQEALSNVIKHSQAREAYVFLESNERGIDLMIVDDGKGFGGVQEDDGMVHLGLVNMRERAEQIGGTFDCPPSGRGVTVTVHVPLQQTTKGGARP
jgi:signal transduction histidine kinase